MEFQKLLSQGPISQDVVLEELDLRGLRGVTIGDLFLINTERPVAEFDEATQTWVPIGTAAPRNESTQRVRVKIGKPLTFSARSEIAKLRERAGLSDAAAHAPERVYPVDPQWRTIAKQAIQGLGDEYSQAVREVAKQEVHLDGGRRHSATDTRDLVVYQLQDDLDIREGSTATLVLGAQHENRAFEVEVVSRFGTELTLSVPADMPYSPSAKLRVDLTWIVGKQRSRLSELLDNAQRFNTTAALAVVTPKPNGASPRLAPHPADDSLNPQQNLAVRHGMTPKLTWLWGPPGTGKTTTLSVLIRDLLAAGRRVLLCGPTNTAVDVALVGALNKLGRLETGRIVRVGQPVDERLANRHIPVLVEEIAAARGQEIARRAVALREEASQLTKKLEQITKARGTTPSSNDRIRLQRRLAEVKEMTNQLDSSLRDVRRQVVRDASLVAATAHQSVLEGLQDQRFDTVVIDEASMMTATLAMLVAGLGNGHTVVAGDFRQLSPVAVSDTPASHKWLHDSPFEAAGVAANVRRGTPPLDLVALTTQHRMRAKISDAVSAGFYPESPLRTADSVTRRRRPPMPFGSAELVAIDTSDLRAWMGRRGGLVSRFNLMHAQIAASIAAASTDVDAAFITPFNCQAALLRPFTADLNRGEASTVHKFQGGEADLVVYDCVDAAGSNFRLHDWFANGSSGGTGARLMNVAASRAREQLVLLADFGRVHRQRGTVDAVYTFMREFLENAERVSWLDVVSDTDSPTSVHPDLDKLGSDIAASDGPIEIRTPSVAPTAMMSLVGPLRDAAKRVPVTIWFSPEPNGDLPMPLLHLLQSDVYLRPTRPVHESMAIVGSIVWSATGAILSDGPGTWLRTRHPGLAEAARMAIRRRSTAYAQGSDQGAERCQCGRPLARVEDFKRTPEMVCLYCEPTQRSVRGRPHTRAVR
ncbi:DEAD/DEAH box helicase [Gordonia paraffinivorans]|uniref:DEAD/DEAH box helicase n=1 Tax=Gordonia paraffinivorans TaxID=175628 RepID=UPI001FD2A1B7|nr:AAA domain-containing protein [Gordonia paraffinivorans]